MLGIELEEEKVKYISKAQHKNETKSKVSQFVFNMLKKKQEGHTKIKHIKFEQHNMQEYLKSKLFNNQEASLLVSLRTRTTRDFKANFPYHVERMCPMGCESEDTPEHILVCDKLDHDSSKYQDIHYEDIFSENVARQAAVTKHFVTLLERREDASTLETGPSHCPGEGRDVNHV